MCGIIGIVGAEPVAGRLIESLQAAGVPRLRLGRRGRRGRTAGSSAAAPRASCATSRRCWRPTRCAATVGIGHTRWATHGAPTERNAHPQTAGRVTVVHNGIIENFAELKAELVAEGRKFESDTDTEVVAHLIDHDLAAGLRARSTPSRRRSTG